MQKISARELTPREYEEQQHYIELYRDLKNRPASYFIVTYGCQMNERDSETLAGYFETMGMGEADSKESADFVIFNTCCVRDNAQRRALGNVTWLKELKKAKPELMVAVCGCMMQQPGMGERILRQYPFVDLAFGTSNLYRLPELLYRSVTDRRRVVEVLDDKGVIPEDLPVQRKNAAQAYVTIMYGCNNFCSYCIVPFVRGRERSRSSIRILEEIEKLKSEGKKEVMLLGQNVNSYGQDKEGEITFAQLLNRVDQTGIERIRFMTSHPKDISDELIAAMARAEHVCRSLHLPVQHGSDRILQSMNRRYTREDYLSKVKKLRSMMPDLALSTDLIVGYPGETEEDFKELCDLVREVEFDSAFTFVYSPREGTKAARMPDRVPEEVSSERIRTLIELQKTITRKKLQSHIGGIHKVLVEGPSKRNPDWMSGKDTYNIMVNFPAASDLIGEFADVRILSAKETTLTGEIVRR